MLLVMSKSEIMLKITNLANAIIGSEDSCIGDLAKPTYIVIHNDNVVLTDFNYNNKIACICCDFVLMNCKKICRGLSK